MYRREVIPDDPTRLFIELNIQKESLFIPMPLILWQAGFQREYVLDIDMHTKTPQYLWLDSVSYTLGNQQRQLLSAQTLPLAHGDFYERSYSPGLYRAQCATAPRIVLSKVLSKVRGKVRGDLRGTFRLYLTTIDHRQEVFIIPEVPIRYYRSRIGPIF